MSKIKRKRKTVNNHPRRPYQTHSASHRGKTRTSRQTLMENAIPSEVTFEQNNSTAISEPSLLCSTPTASVDAPGDVDSNVTIGYGGDNSEKETNKQNLYDDSHNFITLLSENVALYKDKGGPRTENGKLQQIRRIVIIMR